jgi:hypothetical protein
MKGRCALRAGGEGILSTGAEVLAFDGGRSYGVVLRDAMRQSLHGSVQQAASRYTRAAGRRAGGKVGFELSAYNFGPGSQRTVLSCQRTTA